MNDLDEARQLAQELDNLRSWKGAKIVSNLCDEVERLKEGAGFAVRLTSSSMIAHVEERMQQAREEALDEAAQMIERGYALHPEAHTEDAVAQEIADEIRALKEKEAS